MADTRDRLVMLMRATLADQEKYGNWHYRAVRPLPVPAQFVAHAHVDSDCSHGVKLLCRWAGGPDPMGQHFGPYGNSSTIAAHLAHLSRPVQMLPGDIVTFGRWGSEHAAMVLEPGRDPLLWSDGHQGAPNTYRLSADTRERQYLRLPVAVHVPTPEDKLRARTGYWNWLQWKLGEGDWALAGKANGAVRPNVPKLIPRAWWADYTRFMLARRKPNDLPC